MITVRGMSGGSRATTLVLRATPANWEAKSPSLEKLSLVHYQGREIGHQPRSGDTTLATGVSPWFSIGIPR